ncbi:MAG: hypothetical protein HC789_05495 [Microcoleus sp. CSU_2_2]|nr:hypothetical protein [Microcoleus sp. SU_5_3]NJS09863.1 hypothetical protein [Microcoleus sp. CSU_2_2]
MKISADRPNKAFPLNLWDGPPARLLYLLWDGRPARPVFAESGTPHKHHPQIVQRRSPPLCLNLMQHRSRSPLKYCERGLTNSTHPRRSVNLEILLWTYR